MFNIQDLTLRGLKSEDADHLASLYNDTQVAPTITSGLITPWNDKKKTSFTDWLQSSDVEMCCIIEHTETSRFVGMSLLWTGPFAPAHRTCRFSIVLKPEFWGKGYGKAVTRFMVDYAFHQLNMYRVSLEVWEENEKARKLYEKIGFVFEGMERETRWNDGRRYGTIYMGILMPEWVVAKGSVTASAA